jgi:transcriptional regulator with XRE-family HTH domain
MTKEIIANNIWKAIRTSKLTLGEVAKGLGSKGALQNLKYILDGTGNPRLDTMIKLSEILQTPLSKFYENT